MKICTITMCAAHVAEKPIGFRWISSNELHLAGKESEKKKLTDAFHWSDQLYLVSKPKQRQRKPVFEPIAGDASKQVALPVIFCSYMNSIKKILDHLNKISGGSVEIIQRTYQRIAEERAAEAAASMAYYGFFSLFPLLLVVVVVVSTILENMLTQEEVLETLLQAFPFSSDLIAENIQQVLKARSSVGLIGLIGLAWSALGAFTVLMRNINRAWPNTKARNIFKVRLMAFVMLAVMIGGLISMFVFNTVTRFLPQNINEVAEKAQTTQGFSDFLVGGLLFATLLVLYWWLPRTKVRWSEAAIGALVGSLGISLITSGFTWYLQSGLSNYNLVYGSLGAIVALLFWIYLLSLILFAGAHLSAAVAYVKRENGLEPIPKN
jgi:membrane protein